MPKTLQILGLLLMMMGLTACPFGEPPVAPKPPFNPVYGNGSCPMPPGNPDTMSCSFYKDLKNCLLDSCNATCDVPCVVKYCDEDGNFDGRGDAKKQQCVKGCNPGNPNFPVDFGATPVGLVYCPKKFDPPLTSCNDYQERTAGGKKLANLRGVSGDSPLIGVVPDKTAEQMDWMESFSNLSDGVPLEDEDFCSLPSPTPVIPTPTPSYSATPAPVVTPTPTPVATPTPAP